MNGGWIKLHRQFLDNKMWQRDHNSVHVFNTLLLLVDKRSGTWSGGRKQLSEWAGLKESTTYKSLKRLKKAEMVTLSSNNKYTDIHICNWSRFQADGNRSGNNKGTTREQQGNTLTRIENKEIRNIDTKVSSQSSNELLPLHTEICQLFGKSPDRYKLLPKRRITLKARLKDTGKDNIIKACTALANSEWHMGDNDRNWIADPYWCLSSAEKAEDWSSREKQTKGYTGKLSEFEIIGELK